VSQKVGAKNTNGTQCSTVMLRLTFWGRSVTISDEWTIRALLGLSVKWSECFVLYPSEVTTFGS
jgi:hypothetical protein